MNKALLADMFSHWHKSYDNFRTSSLDFYTSLDAEVRRRQIPGMAISQIDRKEAGIFSAKRTYLRVTRQELIFDVCAAPFGTGFFFSWWLTVRRGYPILYALTILLLLLGILKTPLYGSAFSTIGAALMGAYGVLRQHATGFTIVLDLVLRLVYYLVLLLLVPRTGIRYAEESVLAIPVLGRLYEWLFRPSTYYRIDTTLMFQAQVKKAVEMTIDGLMTSNGLRVLTEEEKKPVMREFFR
jgi:hypothetical protein